MKKNPMKSGLKNRIIIVSIEIVMFFFVIFLVSKYFNSRLIDLEIKNTEIAHKSAKEKLSMIVNGVFSDVIYYRNDLINEESKQLSEFIDSISFAIENEESWDIHIHNALLKSDYHMEIFDSEGNIVFCSSKEKGEIYNNLQSSKITKYVGNYKIVGYQDADYIDEKAKQYIKYRLDSRIYFDDEYIQIKEILEEPDHSIYARMFVNPKDKDSEGSLLSLYGKDYPYSEEYDLAINNGTGKDFYYTDIDSNEFIYAFTRYYEPYHWLITASVPENNIMVNFKTLQLQQEKDTNHLIFYLSLVSVVIIGCTIFIMNKNYMALQIQKEKLKNDVKNTFLSQVSHDLRTPLNAIIGLTDLTMNNLEDVDTVRKNLKIVKDSSLHLSAIISDILSLTLDSSSDKTFNESNINLDDLIESLLFVMNPKLEEKNQTIVVKKENVRNLMFRGELDKIKRILENLLGNASKYSFSNDEILFEIKEVEDYTFIFSVIDHGLGISDEDQKHVFEPFFRSDDVKKTSIIGTGLGLALVDRLINELDGKIEIDSKLHKGTKVSVFITFKPPVEDSFVKDKIELDEIKGLSILLVEDHPVNIIMEKQMLESLDFKVYVAENGEQACTMFINSSENEYDLILMDLMMPIMNGIEATKIIRNSNHPQAKTIPIFAVSANAYDKDVKECFSVGMNAHISKPIDANTLIRNIYKIFKRD